MSDPTGPQTAPQKPSFSSDVLPYGPTTITVTSPDGKTILKEEAKPSAYASKGQAPGTFVPKEVKTGKPVPSFTAIPNVGKFEIRNPETEELIRLGKLAKQEGFDFEQEGDEVSAYIPTKYLEDEEKLKKEAEQKAKEAGLLRDLIPRAREFVSLEQAADALKTKIRNPSTLSSLEADASDIKKLFDDLEQSIDESKVETLKEAILQYKRTIARAQAEAAAAPKPTPTPSPTPAPTSAPTPTPTQSPKPLNEYGAWPESIISFQKARKDKQGHRPAGWYSIKNNTRLPEQEGWGLEYDAFKIVYKKYLDLLKAVPAADRRMIKPLIDAKNAVIDAIKKEDLALVESLRSSLEEALDEWRARWEDIKKVKEQEARLNKALKIASRFPEEKKKRVAIDAQKAASLVNGLLQKLSGGDFDEEEYERLAKEVSKYVERVQNVEKGIAFTTEELVNGIFQTDKDGTKKLLGVVRETPQKVSDLSTEEKTKKIKPLGRPEMTMEAYVAEGEAKRAEASKIMITDELEDRLPELKMAGFHVGQKIEEAIFRKIETRALYERQFTRDQNDFLRRYTVPVLDEKNNVIRYVESPLLKSQQRTYKNNKGREVYGIYETIKDILESHGIVVERQNDEERKAQDEKEAQEKELVRSKNRTTFHPDLRQKSWFGLQTKKLKDQYVVGYQAEPNMTRENVLGSQQRYEELKRKREKYLGDAVNYRFAEVEQELDEKMAKALKEYKDGQKNILNRNLVSDWSKFAAALNNYEREIEPLIEAKMEDRKLPADPLERQKRLDAIKKIDEILDVRGQNLAKNAKLQAKKRKMWATMAVPVIAGSLLFGVAKYLEEPGETEKIEEPTPATKTVEQKEDWEQYARNKKLLEYMKKGTPGDRETLAKIAKEFAGLSISETNPASIDAFLNHDAYTILKEPGCYGYDNKQQVQACDLLRDIENISQAINAPERIRKVKTGEYFEHPSNWFVTPNMTVERYLMDIWKKVAQAK